MQKDSTQNIARRYRHLFRLPSLRLVTAYSSFEVLIIASILRYAVLPPTANILADVLPYLVLSEGLFLASVEIDTLALRRASGSNNIPTFRRSASISMVGNGLWLLLSIIGLALSLYSGGSRADSLKLVILGSLFSIAFRSFVFGAVFYDRPIKGSPLALVQPFLLVFSSIYGISAASLRSESFLLAICCGVAFVVAIELYLASINTTQKIKGLRPLELLQAFLDAWVVQDPEKLEEMLDIVSKERTVRTDILELDSDGNGKARVFVPGVHPGPFYPIGSSNLPGEIFRLLHSKIDLPLTVHSISDHDLNLPSKAEVLSYVSSLDVKTPLDRGDTVSIPIVKTKNKATASGFALGSTVVITITQAPNGMEDFPVEVRDKISKYSSEVGFKETLVIDTHNSQGLKPNEEEVQDAIEASRQVLDDLKSSKQFRFKAAFAHTSELVANRTAQEDSRRNDIGPAGIGLILIQVEGSQRKFSLAIFDANNAQISLREQVMKTFDEKTDSKLLEICTSDTHVTAARGIGGKGYLTLGDSTPVEEVASILVDLYENANSRLRDASFSSYFVESNVKTAGGELLDEFSKLLDSTINVAKRGGILLGVLGIAVTVLVLLI